MKKLIIFLLILFVIQEAKSQTDVRAARIIADQSLYVRNRWIDSIMNDTFNLSTNTRALMTSAAVYKFVHGRLSSLAASSVSSVFGRSGAVTALEADYQSFYPRLSELYSNPTWISALAWSKITGTPTTRAGYGITDAAALNHTHNGLIPVGGLTGQVMKKLSGNDYDIVWANDNSGGTIANADSLDGEDSPYYLDLTNHTGTLPQSAIVDLESDLNSKVDSVTANSDTSFLRYWVNGTPYNFFEPRTGLTGNDTTIFQNVIDSTLQPGSRILWGYNNKIRSSPYLLYDSANRKVVINHNNVSIGGPNTKLFVKGNATVADAFTMGNGIISTTPTTSAGGFDILTRNTSNGNVEKKASSFYVATADSGTAYTTPTWVTNAIAGIATPTLQQVTDEGNLTTAGLGASNFTVFAPSTVLTPAILSYEGVNSGNRGGYLALYDSAGSGFYGKVRPATLTTNRTYLLPDASGTIALTSDITGGYTNLTQFTGQNNWRVFYSNGSGDVQELALGAANTVLYSNGASSAPTFSAPFTLTTTGSTGAATFSGGTLNIPNYSSGGTTWNGTISTTNQQATGYTMAGEQQAIFTGSSPATFTLPVYTTNRAYYVKNKGTATLTVASNEGTTNINGAAGAVSTYAIPAGESRIFLSGASAWNVYAEPGTGGGSYTDEQAQDAVGAMATNSSKVSLTYSDATPSLTADIVAGSLVNADINASAAIAYSKLNLASSIAIADLSATGTPSSTTYLRGDNTWATIAGGGDVTKVGTPANNQIAVWTGDGTVEGSNNFTHDNTGFGQVKITHTATNSGNNNANPILVLDAPSGSNEVTIDYRINGVSKGYMGAASSGEVIFNSQANFMINNLTNQDVFMGQYGAGGAAFPFFFDMSTQGLGINIASYGSVGYNLDVNGTGHFSGNLLLGNNVSIGTTSIPTSATNTLTILNGTPPSAAVANAISIYSEAGEATVIDAAFNESVFSPHRFKLMEASDPMAWSFYSRNQKKGYEINVDMYKAVKTIEEQSKSIEELKKEIAELKGKAYEKKEPVKLIHKRNLKTGVTE